MPAKQTLGSHAYRVVRGSPARHLDTAQQPGTHMTFTRLRTFAIALIALVALSFASTARADEGRVHIRFLKGGWVIGGTIGEGTLTFRGRRYPLSIGGLSYGLTFGGSVDQPARPRPQHQFAARCRRRLWRGLGRRRRDPRSAGRDPHQPERRGDGIVRQPDRVDGQSRSQRHGGVAAISDGS